MLSALESASREDLLAVIGLLQRQVAPEKETPPKSGRKRGRQPAAGGAGLAMVADPDITGDHVPVACTDCGNVLEQGDSISFERRQVRDIPPVTVTVTEHRAHRCRCVCGTVTAEPMPEQIAGSPSSYGPNLRAPAASVLGHVVLRAALVDVQDEAGRRSVESRSWRASDSCRRSVSVRRCGWS